MRPMIVGPVIRNDPAGRGHFGAPRGSRTHRGVDYLCAPGSLVYSPVDGIVTRLGYCYTKKGDNGQEIVDEKWRYIEITDDLRRKHRVLYAVPLIGNGECVYVGQAIGECQDITARYEETAMMPHIHYEIISGSGQYLDPELL